MLKITIILFFAHNKLCGSVVDGSKPQLGTISGLQLTLSQLKLHPTVSSLMNHCIVQYLPPSKS